MPQHIDEGELARELDYVELREAMDAVMVGGNHLANYLIGNLGAGFATEWPPHSKPAKVRKALSANDYDVWCCWAAIMRARRTMEATS